MSPMLTFILSLLATHAGLKVNLNIEKDEVKRMLEREEYLHQEMTRLLKEMQGSSGTMEALLSLALQQQWLLWASAATLLLGLLGMGCCLVRRKKRGSASCREQRGAKRRKAVSSEEKQGLPSTKVLKELVDELLGVCRVLSRRSFMPELHPGPGCSCDTCSECCSIQESNSTYRPLVILRPPPGHSFSLESTERPPARRIRVALECLCTGEQLLGQTCFLHASGGLLPQDQDWYLLDTLCTGSCLDPKKVTQWVQMLVASAWRCLPQSRYYHLTALPSSKSCIWQLSSTCGLHCRIELALAVQQDGSGAFLSLE
ncbi:inositol 1,4,5-trisphosphate receptor-interacting protein-like 1 [Oenanthe melanoleuca]|uniref:inositol 1,4,5-trisphosphate receptor-interacting protein-like 1 n=1 Tax=Oenanthe melanoleuca TaxID=2939378 RepID=UPI0024C0F25F|nr:inositol 1,4,5-trisphosphate receptor-interacting protein-like 1 [Oenanthe melanoleuca]